MSRLALIGGLWCQLALMAALVLCAGPAFATDTVYYYLSDALHSEVVVTDQNRNVVERTYYAPYGQVLSRSLRDGPGYAGAAEDPGTGLDYMQQRYYDPQTGRFISTDPVAVSPAGGNFNRYAYANDNPYRYTDPTGMCTGTHNCNPDGTAVSTGGYTTDINGAEQGLNRSLAGAKQAAIGVAKGVVNTLEGWMPHPQDEPTAFGIQPYDESAPLTPSNGAQAAGMVAGGILIAAGAAEVDPALAEGDAAVIGNAERTVVIGRDMAGRVAPYADSIGADYYRGTPQYIPFRNQRLDLWFNRRWIRGEMQSDSKIIDIGEPPGMPPSVFYNMERDEASGYLHYHPDPQP